ncbi:MAG: DUF1501 domain-containing protein, partial [Nitrososphaeraceae archaeon]|nr:DUF1501 domain-containing protein [Nitrososphaeraceae archaeon]
NEVQEAPDSRAGEKLKYIRLIAQQSQQYGQVLKDAASKVTSQRNYPSDNELAQQLKVIARLMKGGIQTPVYLVRLGGFDTHDAQVLASDHTLGEHNSLLTTLNDAIMAFMKDLEFLGIDDDVVGMTFSEFGRRIVSNASLGTDHGAAAPIIVFGNKVRGEIIGDDPIISRSTTYADNLPMQFDYRQVYSSLMQQWLGKNEAEATEVLLKEFDSIPIIGESVLKSKKPLSNTELKLYPNPVYNSINYEFEHDGGLFTIEVFDLSGKKRASIYRGNEHKGKQIRNWDATELPSGRYKLVYKSKLIFDQITFIKM